MSLRSRRQSRLSRRARRSYPADLPERVRSSRLSRRTRYTQNSASSADETTTGLIPNARNGVPAPHQHHRPVSGDAGKTGQMKRRRELPAALEGLLEFGGEMLLGWFFRR